jgi:hypothetical protein
MASSGRRARRPPYRVVRRHSPWRGAAPPGDPAAEAEHAGEPARLRQLPAHWIRRACPKSKLEGARERRSRHGCPRATAREPEDAASATDPKN